MLKAKLLTHLSCLAICTMLSTSLCAQVQKPTGTVPRNDAPLPPLAGKTVFTIIPSHKEKRDRELRMFDFAIGDNVVYTLSYEKEFHDVASVTWSYRKVTGEVERPFGNWFSYQFATNPSLVFETRETTAGEWQIMAEVTYRDGRRVRVVHTMFVRAQLFVIDGPMNVIKGELVKYKCHIFPAGSQFQGPLLWHTYKKVGATDLTNFTGYQGNSPTTVELRFTSVGSYWLMATERTTVVPFGTLPLAGGLKWVQVFESAKTRDEYLRRPWHWRRGDGIDID